ncbi:MAG: oligosaccharide flippase family protein [Acidobacteriales bacterium]|nr:oligosaccharide flippase family protein [Terriglobales bacterium]
MTEMPALEQQKSGHARRRLLGNMAALYLLQGLNYLIPMATLPYLVRVLGIETYGVIAFTQSFAQYFTILTDYGFNFSATRYIAKNRSEHTRITNIFWRVMIVKAILLCSGVLILAAILLWVPRFHTQLWFFAVAYISVIGGVLFPQWYFQGVEKMKHISLVTGSARIVTSGLLFVLVRSSADALTAITLLSAGPLLAGIIGLWVACRELLSLRVTRRPAISALLRSLFALSPASLDRLRRLYSRMSIL